jgi:hypothetical protein
VAVTHLTDEKARINLPKDFANSTVLIEQISDTELRIRKARVIPEDDLPFVEEAVAPLSDRDRDVFLALLDNPPPPNEDLRRLLTSRPVSCNQSETDDMNMNQSGRCGDLWSLSWPDYFARVRAELYPPDYRHPSDFVMMQERLQVICEIRELFAQSVHFRGLDYLSRRKIAGLVKSDTPNFLLFGSMQWVGKFKLAIKDNNEQISLALDEIPLDGNISRERYQRFTDRFLSAFDRSGMATASRLLAMKRPDMFVCINNQNREELFQAFGVSPSRDANSYWDLIEKVWACSWWKSPAPPAGDELEVWRARAAFLDALCYTGVGFESGSHRS